jgi:hypothetical protein
VNRDYRWALHVCPLCVQKVPCRCSTVTNAVAIIVIPDARSRARLDDARDRASIPKGQIDIYGGVKG